MKFGLHISIAGGLEKAFARALDLGCDTMQIFTRNPRGWKFSALGDREVAAFKEERAKNGIGPVAVHMPYLPNLAVGDKEKKEKSVSALSAELERAERLGCEYLVTHLGKGLGASVGEALENVTSGLNEAIVGSETENVTVLLENASGQGTEIGTTIDELAKVLKELNGLKNRVGICLDTCHAHAAGFDLSLRQGLESLLEQIEQQIGIDRLKILHLNDAQKEAGSRVDRHQHIGLGTIGKTGFSNIVRHPLLKELPGIMETPVNDQGDDEDNMKMIRSIG